MFNRRIQITLVLSALLVSGCANGAVSTSTAGSTSSDTTAATAPSDSKTLPADFPVPVYKDAKITQVDHGTDSFTGGPTTSVAYNAINDVKVVRAFYEAELPKAGWTIRPNVIEQDNGHITMVADKGDKAVTIGLYPKFEQNGDSRYSLIVEPKK